MGSGSQGDVSSGLNELESKLRELEQAFQTLGHDSDDQPVAAQPEPAGDEPAPIAPRVVAAPSAQPVQRADAVQAQIDELVRSHERLTATMQALVADVSGIVDGLAQVSPRGPETAGEQPSSVYPPAPDAFHAPVPRAAAAPSAAVEPTPAPVARSVRDYAPNPPPPRDPFQGLVVVDVGPLGDRAAMGAFREALTRVPGARDVRVRTFDDERAVIEVQLEEPVDLLSELRRLWPKPLTATAADTPAGRLVLALEPAAVDGA